MELQICESRENVEFGVINENLKIAMKAFLKTSEEGK